VRPGADEGRLGKAQEGRTLAVGAAEIPTANLQIYSAGPTRSPLEEVMRAILADLVLALAPLLAVGALLMMLRRHVQRAEVAEEEVERVEERFRIASATARAGFFEWRLDEGDRLAISEPLSSLLRQPRNEATISQILEIIPPDERVQIDQAFSRARETGALDISFRAASGHSVVWIEMRGFDISEDGEHARMIGTARDISARREAEMRATTLQRRLREAIDGFSGPFALWDSRRRLIVWNRSFQSLFKLEPAVLRAGASYDSVWMAAAKQIRRERTDPSDSQSREIELANGDWLRIQERRTAEGGLLAIGIDVTPIKKQEEALKERESTLRAAVEKLERSEGRNKELARSFEEQKHRAEAASRAKSEFLANMSHELRTPLNAIIGFSDIMAGQMFGKLGDDRYASYAKDIHASGELLLELISDVLDMAKIEAGKHNLAPRLLDPMDAIEQAVRLVKRRAEEKGLQVRVDAPEDLPEIEADLRAVKQVLLNLLSNGVKFTDKGGVMIEARAAEDGGGVVFRVIDTGKGIAAEDLPRLARPFEQVADHSEKARDHQGTGLGLALTKSLVEMHGGRIDISSQLGKGTVVTIFLPLKFRGGDSATAVAAE
jgi:two-component system cell cycle sensor histidine kinase PleC